MATTKIRSSSITDGQVSNADLSATVAVTGGQIADDAVTLAKMADGTQGGIIHYGAAGAPVELAAGTDGYFLKTRGAGANPLWSEVVAGNNTPMFSAYLSSDQNIADATNVKVEFDTITITDGGTYDNSTNYRWTPGVIGKYVIKTSLGLYHVGGNNTDIEEARVRFYINGSEPSPEFKFDNMYGYSQNTLPGWVHLQSDAVISMNATDYLEIYAYINHRWTAYQNYIAGNQASYFSAFKLIGS